MKRKSLCLSLIHIYNKLKGTTSAQQISQKSGDSQPQIYRYIRLTELVPEILQMVDDKMCIRDRPGNYLSVFVWLRSVQMNE